MLMSIPNTPPEPHDTTDAGTERPGPWDRAVTAMAWYAPELTGVTAAGAAAATVWAPLGAISAALAAWITTDQVKLARARRRAHRAVEQRTERAQLDTAKHTDTEHDHAVDGDVSATDEHAAEQTEGERPGWEVAG